MRPMTIIVRMVVSVCLAVSGLLAVAPAQAAGELRIPSVGVTAPVVKVGMNRTGIIIPENPAHLGWWKRSATNRSHRGNSIVVGHVSDSQLNLGVFAQLRRTHRGDIVVWRTGEFTKRYRIVSKKKFLRSRPLPPRLFRMHGKHFLRMITCSDLVKLPDGYFHYTKNLVVTAEEVQ